MLIINSPSNPSGAVLSPRRVREDLSSCRVERGIYLMTDECYCHFLYEGEPFLDRRCAGRERARAGGRDRSRRLMR